MESSRMARWGPRLVRAVPAVAGLAVLLVVGGVGSFVARGATLQEYVAAWLPQNATVGLVATVVFAVALRRQPENRAAWCFLVSGIVSAVHVTGMALLHGALDRSPQIAAALDAGTITMADLPPRIAGPMWLVTTIWLWSPGLAMTFGLLLFPDGHLPSRRWRGVVWLGVVGLVLSTAAWAWAYRPWSPHVVVENALPTSDAMARALFLVGMPLLGAASLLTIASLVVRLRAAPPDERRRVRPVVVTGSLVLAVMVLLYPWQALWAIVTIPAVLLLLVTIAASVARHRLFDVEVVVSRAVTATVLGAVITLTWVGIVAGVGRLLGSGADLWLSVIATAIVAVGFEPLRRRVLAATTRLVTGTSATPYEVLGRLSDRLARADSTGEVLDRVVQLLLDGTGATRVEVRSRDDGGSHLDAVAGAELDDPAIRSAPVVNEGELLGEVRLLAGRQDHFLPSDERLLGRVAATLGPVLRNARLTRELHQHIAELEASRQRIVTAHDEARRALERDIHDGAQQQLLSLRLRLGLASTLAEGAGDADVATAIEAAAADADTAIRLLRDLARGLYPPVLGEQGLESALRARARSLPLPVTLEACGVGRYDRGVEATVYFCCAEAMQNACKHAADATVHVELVAADGALQFAVTDDGPGFDPQRVGRGAGLANMLDRVEGLGGWLRVTSAPGRGTTIHGHVPVPTPSPDGQSAVSER